MEALFAFDHRHDVFLTHDYQLIAIHLYFGTAVLTEKNPVADLQVDRANFAVFQNLTLTNSNNLPKNRLFSRSIRDHDAACGLTLFLFSFHDHAVMKGTNLHKRLLPMLGLRVI